jgi:hypothetical protein
MSPETAARLLRWWTRVYTAAMPAAERERRRAEVEADLWESLRDPAGSRQILSRWLLGVADDVGWSINFMEPTSKSSLSWSVGSLLTVSVLTVFLLYAPESAAMREWSWTWPATIALHVIGIVALIALRMFVDLRVIGLSWAVDGTPVTTLAQRITPWTVIAAVVVLATGLALVAGEPRLFATNSIFQLKIAAVVLALANAWYLHAVALRDVAKWDSRGTRSPPAARASAYLSLVLWVVVIGSSVLAPYAL